MNIAYCRVSSEAQNEQRQIEALEPRNIDKWFVEKVSGKDANRPKLQEMLEFARQGDTIYIHDLSRLGRSVSDLLHITQQLQEKGVELVSNKENIDTSSPTGKLIFTMIAAIAQFERENLKERQREGIAIAKRKGKYEGRKPKDYPEFDRLYSQWQAGNISKSAMARELGVHRNTVDRLLCQKGTV